MRAAVKRAAAAVATAAALATSAPAAAAAPAAVAVAGEFEKPWFYHKLDGPRFTVTNTSADGAYETRRVEATAWAVVEIEDGSLMTALNKGFRSLFRYISGANEGPDGQPRKVEMTVPVITYVRPGAGPGCASRFTVGFMTPWADQESPDGPPTPTDPAVSIKRTGAADFYVASKGGWVMTDGAEAAMAAALVERLQADGKDVVDAVFLAGYDPPFRLLNRHNEVWIPTDEKSLKSFWGPDAKAATE